MENYWKSTEIYNRIWKLGESPVGLVNGGVALYNGIEATI